LGYRENGKREVKLLRIRSFKKKNIELVYDTYVIFQIALMNYCRLIWSRSNR